MQIATIIVGAILGLWLLLTAICQFRGEFSAKIRRWDSFFLLPAWTFFSPNPGTKDYRLAAQDVDSDNGDWVVVELTKPNGPLSFLFNPNKIRKKCLIDIANQTIEARNNLSAEPRLLWITHAYLSALNRAQSATDTMDGFERFRFAIIASGGYFNKDELSLVVVSKEHSRDEV